MLHKISCEAQIKMTGSNKTLLHTDEKAGSTLDRDQSLSKGAPPPPRGLEAAGDTGVQTGHLFD